jgi:hypothetical protein
MRLPPPEMVCCEAKRIEIDANRRKNVDSTPAEFARLASNLG